jgi:acyl-coenzyme A thioesterase PaaI-like protein
LDAPGAASTAHEQLAAATRRLVDAVLRARATDSELGAATRDVEELVRRLEPGRLADRASAEARTEAEYLPRSPFVGRLSPVAPPFSYERTGDGVLARGAFGVAAQGPPGYVHGGWVALAFDEALGMANSAAGHAGVTGRLTVRYRRPTPLHTEVTLEARTVRVDGRRISTVGALRAGSVLTAEADALFVVLGAERARDYFDERRSTPETTEPLP